MNNICEKDTILKDLKSFNNVKIYDECFIVRPMCKTLIVIWVILINVFFLSVFYEICLDYKGIRNIPSLIFTILFYLIVFRKFIYAYFDKIVFLKNKIIIYNLHFLKIRKRKIKQSQISGFYLKTEDSKKDEKSYKVFLKTNDGDEQTIIYQRESRKKALPTFTNFVNFLNQYYEISEDENY